jgi:hypothetical protein
MITNTSAADARAAIDKSAPKPGATRPPGSPERIDWLFRDASRNQQVHPLMDLVRRYHEKDAP